MELDDCSDRRQTRAILFATQLNEFAVTLQVIWFLKIKQYLLKLPLIFLLVLYDISNREQEIIRKLLVDEKGRYLI